MWALVGRDRSLSSKLCVLTKGQDELEYSQADWMLNRYGFSEPGLTCCSAADDYRNQRPLVDVVFVLVAYINKSWNLAQGFTKFQLELSFTCLLKVELSHFCGLWSPAQYSCRWLRTFRITVTPHLCLEDGDDTSLKHFVNHINPKDRNRHFHRSVNFKSHVPIVGGYFWKRSNRLAQILNLCIFI